jgi:hypothetical protein
MKKLFIPLMTASLLMGSYPAHAFDIKWEKKHTYIIAAAVALVGFGIYSAIKGRQASVRAAEDIGASHRAQEDSRLLKERERKELIANRPNTTVIIANEFPTPTDVELTFTRIAYAEESYPPIQVRSTIDSESVKAFKIPMALSLLHENGWVVKPTLTVRAHGLPNEQYQVNIVDKPTVAITIKPKQLIGIEQAA